MCRHTEKSAQEFHTLITPLCNCQVCSFLFDSHDKCESIDLMISARLADWMAKYPYVAKNCKHCDLLRHYKYDNCQTLHDGGTH